MNKKLKIAVMTLITLMAAGLVVFLLGHKLAVLSPQGSIGLRERNLMFWSTLLMLIVVVPVFVLTFTIAWRYRAGNKSARYTPNWDHHRGIEFLWWALPCVIIFILAVMTWVSSHSLDPFRPIASKTKPLTIQVVALQWKWLFIYPDQGIATVNYVQFPENTPINFVITSDAPMNSFWIPQLGGQVYAMSGMSTQLHLDATKVGTYDGSSANLSGAGFAGMKFTAKATTEQDFSTWVQHAQQSSGYLGQGRYTELAKPSENNAVATYSNVARGLYDSIISKYMTPPGQAAPASSQPTMIMGAP
jgi:cytochrome o ubiquinol oxidase subunit 2